MAANFEINVSENKDGFDQGDGVTHRVPWKQQALKLVKIFF